MNPSVSLSAFTRIGVPAGCVMRIAFAIPAVALVTACVTINIYFPAAAAEKAADRIIDEIYQLHKDAPASTSPSAPAPAANPAPSK